jgi:hypothetical protein
MPIHGDLKYLRPERKRHRIQRPAADRLHRIGRTLHLRLDLCQRFSRSRPPNVRIGVRELT